MDGSRFAPFVTPRNVYWCTAAHVYKIARPLAFMQLPPALKVNNILTTSYSEPAIYARLAILNVMKLKK